MRITAGECRGRVLYFPSRSSQRPTTDFLRSALFNLLGLPAPCDILDLFAGSGAVGLEALSRGAQSATFVEKSRALAAAIRKNAGMCGYQDRCLIIEADVGVALGDLYGRDRKFDLVFADPPYNQGLIAETICSLKNCPVFTAKGVVVFQHSLHEPLPPPDGWELADQRKYSDNVLSFVRMPKT